MTLDGNCDHTAGIADAELHQHYADLLGNAGVVLYGRTTYQLMEYWKGLVANPSGQKDMDDFALVMDRTPKIVFSNTLKELDWDSAKLATKGLEEEVAALKQEPGKDICVGSRSLIIQLLNLHIVDELQLCIHPVIAGDGLQLFDNINDRTILKLITTKTFASGAIVLYYQPNQK